MPNVDEIKNAIVDREKDLERIFASEKIISREIYPYAKTKVSKNAALVITGPRRCGKSTLAYALSREQASAYVNFDDERLAMPVAELNKVLEAAYSLKGNVDRLVFDEIQNITGWEKFVSRLIHSKEIILTGSNANLLSSELATHLTGRHIDLTLFPFSFKEYLASKEAEVNIHHTPQVANLKNHFGEYLENGGFPLTPTLGSISLAETYKDILERDIIQRHPIRYPAPIKELAKYLVSNAANEVTFNKLKSIIQVKSAHTVKKYADYLSNAYLVFFLDRFSFKLKEQNLAPKKIYCIDNGLVNVIGFRTSENRGRAMENLAAIELMRRKSRERSELYYWKDHAQREVDFLVKKENRVVQLIQVTDASAKTDLREREIKAMLKASQELKCDDLLVLTREFEADEESGDQTIRYRPLWKWLLETR